jgi:hypothetical protein
MDLQLIGEIRRHAPRDAFNAEGLTVSNLGSGPHRCIAHSLPAPHRWAERVGQARVVTLGLHFQHRFRIALDESLQSTVIPLAYLVETGHLIAAA